MREVKIPDSYNYVACFLTLACNLSCDYCLNYLEGSWDKTHLSGDDWIRGLNRLVFPPGVPLTIQGGEPAIHKDFYRIVNGLNSSIKVDLLTNGTFDASRFIGELPPNRFRADTPYPSIRVSYHPVEMDINGVVATARKLKDAGFNIGIWGVEDPRHFNKILEAEKICREYGIEYRTKEILGEIGGKLYGTFKYAEACTGTHGPRVECKTSELLISPRANIYRCHSDLYSGRSPVGNLIEDDFAIEDIFRECSFYGSCNPCDVKLKTDRNQNFGHASVTIRFGSEEETRQHVQPGGWSQNRSPNYRVGGLNV